MSTNLSLNPAAADAESPFTLTLSVGQSSYQIVLPHAGTDYLQKRLVSDRVPYELQMLEDMRSRVFPGALVLDIGAKTGNFSLYLAAVAGCRVESFEPDPELCAALHESIALNGLAEHVQLHEVQLGREDGMVRIGAGELRVYALDNFQFDRKVEAIKLGVEGMEIDVLEGASQLLQRDRPLVYVECGSEAQYRRVARWMSARDYARWHTFDAAPTHLFIPGERLSVEQLNHLQAKAARDDYRSNRLLQEVRERLSQTQEKEREARVAMASAQAQEREVRAALAKAQARDHEMQTALANTRRQEHESRTALASVQTKERRGRAALAEAQAREREARATLAEAQAKELQTHRALVDLQTLEHEMRAALSSERDRLSREAAQLRDELDRATRSIKDLRRAVEASELKLAATKKRATAFAERLQFTRESASFQIGQALIAAGKSARGALRLPRELMRIYRSARRRRIEESEQTSAPEAAREKVRGTTPSAAAAPVAASAPGGTSLPRPDKVRLAGVPYMSRPLDGVAGHQEVHTGRPLVSVVMTSYNTGVLIEPAVKSILAQTWTNLELIVVDDCSTDDTRAIVERLAATDPRIKLFCFGVNRGTYWCKNFGITQSSGVAVTFMDSDDTSHPSRVELQFEALNRPGYAVSTCNHIRVDTEGKTISINGVTERIAYISQMMKRSVIREVGYFDSIRTSADDEMLRRIKVTYGPEAHTNVRRVLYTALLRDGSLTRDPENAINFVQPREENQSFLSPQRRHYAAMVTRWHESLAQQNLRPYMPFPVVRRPFPVFGKLIVSPGRYDRDMISACVASYPPRRDKLEAVVAALLPQVDQLFVYLNEYDEVPDFLRHSRITVELGGRRRDLRDNGKFFFAAKAPAGYVLTVDDDIVYPADYVQALVRKIEFYERRAVVGVHGTIFDKPIRNYFRGRTLYHFELPLEHDVVVNQLGTGTAAFHTELLRPDFDAFRTTGMADVWLALQCKAAKAPMIAISREAGWLQPMGIEETTLFREFRKDDSHQTKLVKSVAPWREEIVADLGAIVDARRREFGDAYSRLLPRPPAVPVPERAEA